MNTSRRGFLRASVAVVAVSVAPVPLIDAPVATFSTTSRRQFGVIGNNNLISMAPTKAAGRFQLYMDGCSDNYLKGGLW